jgi:hypothetical protein
MLRRKHLLVARRIVVVCSNVFPRARDVAQFPP